MLKKTRNSAMGKHVGHNVFKAVFRWGWDHGYCPRPASTLWSEREQDPWVCNIKKQLHLCLQCHAVNHVARSTELDICVQPADMWPPWPYWDALIHKISMACIKARNMYIALQHLKGLSLKNIGPVKKGIGWLEGRTSQLLSLFSQGNSATLPGPEWY